MPTEPSKASCSCCRTANKTARTKNFPIKGAVFRTSPVRKANRLRMMSCGLRSSFPCLSPSNSPVRGIRAKRPEPLGQSPAGNPAFCLNRPAARDPHSESDFDLCFGSYFGPHSRREFEPGLDPSFEPSFDPHFDPGLDPKCSRLSFEPNRTGVYSAPSPRPAGNGELSPASGKKRRRLRPV